MDVSQSSRFGGITPPAPPPELDPRLQPTPDYGTLGPGSDVAGYSVSLKPTPVQKPQVRLVQLIAVGLGVFAALLAGVISKANRGLTSSSHPVSGEQRQPASAKDLRQIDRMIPQKQAETLLELAVGHSPEAVDQISARADRWPGRIRWSSQIATLSAAALNSDDLRIRESGVEVELAAYGLAKNSASLDYLLKASDSSDHKQKIWALWALGLMGNRGVNTEQVVGVLTSHLKDSDVDSRRWAVEGLALTGSDQTIEPLLKTMHDDTSPVVRERAACSLAVSGLFTPEQRLTAVPALLNYTDDNSLDARTHGWAFQALGDITHQRLPNDSAAWRSWYDSTKQN
jgi:HEAT repeat protein